MLSKQDISYLKTIFPTKIYLKTYLDKRFNDFEERFEEKIDKKFQDLKSEIFNMIDPVYKELVAMREEQTLLSHKVYEDHETRISIIESSSKSS